MNDRPILIDEQDGPCPYCAEWTRKKNDAGGRARNCDECGRLIPHYPGMFGNGIESVYPHHYHLRLVNGGPTGRVAVRQELCLECYVAHRAKYFPEGPTVEKMLADHEDRHLRDTHRAGI